MLAFTRVDVPKVVLLHADGSLTDLPVAAGSCANPNYEPQWFPNRKQLIYLTNGCGTGWDVAVTRLDATRTVDLTPEDNNQLGGVVSPDGSQIVFMKEEDVRHTHLWSMRTDGTDQRQLTFGPASERYPSFSPDGRWLAMGRWVGGGCQVWLMATDGTRLHRVTSGKAKNCVTSDEGAAGPEWSPTGRRIAFESRRSGRWQIHLLNPITKRVRQVTDLPGQNLSPTWLGGGRRIAFERWQAGGQPHLYSIRLDGTGVHRLTTVPSGQPAAWRRTQCRGRPGTVFGDGASNVLRGTHGDDVIVAGSGDDRVASGAGDDLVCGGGGEDRIITGTGADSAFGEAGTDWLSGGPGSDLLVGGPGRDWLRGGPGADHLED
ncbi:hypothetical protein [Nocardioides sp. YIM 152588]|uniref:hypothetical protein n=1 Tax=Nocardioides sp. YIM 152588 TaxID=3158259 RepID=UPI0032E467C5